MIKIEFPDKSVFCIFKGDSKQGLISKLIISEQAYGEVPTIEFEFQSDKLLCEVNEVIEGYLIHPNGMRQDFSMYCYSIHYFNATQTIKFILMDPEMNKTPYNYSYPGLIDGIKATYKGKILSDFLFNDPVSGNDNYGRKIKVYQRNESNLKFCNRLCWSYRYDHIFAYTIEGLKFLDLKSVEPVDTVKDDSNFHIEIPPEWMESKYYPNRTSEVDYSLGNDPNHANITYLNRIIPVNIEYVEMIQNNLHNLRYNNTKLQVTAKVTQLFPYKLLDGLKIESKQANYIDTFIAGRVIEYTKGKTQVTYTVQSVKL